MITTSPGRVESSAARVAVFVRRVRACVSTGWPFEKKRYVNFYLFKKSVKGICKKKTTTNKQTILKFNFCLFSVSFQKQIRPLHHLRCSRAAPYAYTYACAYTDTDITAPAKGYDVRTRPVMWEGCRRCFDRLIDCDLFLPAKLLSGAYKSSVLLFFAWRAKRAVLAVLFAGWAQAWVSRSKAPTQLFDQNNLALALRAAAAAFPCGSAAALLRSGVPGDGQPVGRWMWKRARNNAS